MSIFGKILGGIFGKKKEDEFEKKKAEVAPVETPTSQEAAPEPAAPVALEPVPEAELIDVNALMEEKAAAHPEDLDWKTSIVDLLKLLGIDSSYSSRKELAVDMGIVGYEGTAEQNIKMHKETLKYLSENGGIVPEDLLV